MIKIVEQIKNQEDFKEFQKHYSETCLSIVKHINELLDAVKEDAKVEFINAEEIKKEIEDLIMIKLTVKVPDDIINQIPIINAEQEPKSKKQRKKTKSKLCLI